MNNAEALKEYAFPIAARKGVLAEAIIAAAAVQVGGIFVAPPRWDNTDDMIVGELVARLLLALRERGSSYYTYYNPFRFDDKKEPLDPMSVSLDDLERHRGWLRKTGPDSYAIYPQDHSYLFHQEMNPAAGIIGMVRDYFAAGSGSDFTASVRAYRASRLKQSELYRQVVCKNVSLEEQNNELARQMSRWNNLRLLSHVKINTMENTIHQMEKLVRQASLLMPPSLFQEREFDSDALTKALSAGMVGGVSTTHWRSDYINEDTTFSLAYSSALAMSARRPHLILAANVFPLSGKHGQVMIADMTAPLKPEWLHEVRPDLVQEQWLDDHEYQPDPDEVHATRILRFGRLKINQQLAPCSDEKAQAAFRRWFARSMGAAPT